MQSTQAKSRKEKSGSHCHAYLQLWDSHGIRGLSKQRSHKSPRPSREVPAEIGTRLCSIKQTILSGGQGGHACQVVWFAGGLVGSGSGSGNGSGSGCGGSTRCCGAVVLVLVAAAAAVTAPMVVGKVEG